MPQIKSNFTLRSKASNFERDSFESIRDMKNVNPGHMDEGHISYCRETRKHYVFNMDHEFDENTGYFKLLTTGVSDDSAGGNSITNIIYDTLEEMRDDMESDLQLGQIVYCRETKSHYYYAFDSNYEVQDPNQIPFDENTGYFREFETSSSSTCEEDIKEIMDYLWPVKISIGGTSGTYRQGNSVKDVFVSWEVTKKDELLVADKVTINNLDITNNLDLISGKYMFDNEFVSNDTSSYSSSINNNVTVNYEDVTLTETKTLTFIYPKYFGYIVGSADEVNSIKITGDNVMNYIKSGEILSGSINQTINIPSNTGTGRWLYVYPKALGNVKSIIDGNGFNQMEGVSKEEIDIIDSKTSKSIKYNVYIQTISSDISNLTIKIN